VTHASGNPTWQDYPSTATLITAGRLEGVEGAADQLYVNRYGSTARTRRADCWVYTTGTWAIPATTFTLLKSTPTWLVARDTEAKWNSNATASYYEIPYGGRLWDLSFRCTVATSTLGGCMIIQILVNGTTPSVHPITAGSRPYQSGECNPIAHLTGVPLNAGDRVYFGAYSTHAVNIQFIWGGTVPEVLIRDAGPA
jgi:hypothetical protein